MEENARDLSFMFLVVYFFQSQRNGKSVPQFRPTQSMNRPFMRRTQSGSQLL